MSHTTPSQKSPSEPLATGDLLLLLEKEPEFEPILENYGGSFDALTFDQYLNVLLSARSITAARLSELALLSRAFSYQLCSGVRLPGRDIVLRLAVVLELTTDETQRLLRSAQRGALYPKVRRDAAVIFALNQKMNLFDTDELLRSLHEEPLL